MSGPCPANISEAMACPIPIEPADVVISEPYVRATADEDKEKVLQGKVEKFKAQFGNLKVLFGRKFKMMLRRG